jgi:hypothetical protein
LASSDTAQISTIVDLIQVINPNSILDVGCGYGKYGFLSKEYLMGDVWDKSRTTVNGVEGYAKYIGDLQREIYNEIFICDAMNFSEYLIRDYDLVCIIDAFEHLPAEDGKKFIMEVQKNAKYLLISIPRYVTAQMGLTEDEKKFEEHRSFWTRKMFKSLGNCMIVPNNARKTIALYSSTGEFSSDIRKFCLKKLYMKLMPYIIADVSNFLKWYLNKNNKELFIKQSKL